ncbi:macro domain-containing protein [Aquirufa sp. OSTEICH-129A]
MKIAIPDTTPFSFSILLTSALILSIIIKFPMLFYEVEIADTDIKLQLIVGNYLKHSGDKVIATNSTFDTTHKGNFISPKSVQGQFYKEYYDNIAHLDNDLEIALSSENPLKILSRTKSKNKQYNIGTVAKLTHKQTKPFWKIWGDDTEFRTYWIAMADVNEFGKPSSNFENLQTSLVELWQFISTKGHLENLAIPILGSGRTGLVEKRERVLQEIVFSFVAFATEKKLTEKLTIVIHPADLLKYNLNFYELCDFIKFNCKYKSSKNFGKSVAI